MQPPLVSPCPVPTWRPLSRSTSTWTSSCSCSSRPSFLVRHDTDLSKRGEPRTLTALASSVLLLAWTAEVLRLQLIRPDENTALYEALYGMLMLMPQTSAFVTLRNRLNSVSSLGVLALQPNRPYVGPTL